MKLKEIREAYEALSGTLSNIVRQLAFAGIGIIWIFYPSKEIPKSLAWALIFLILTLVLDLLQYLISTAIWHYYYHKEYKKNRKEDRDVLEQESYNYFSWFVFYSKAVTLFIAYIILSCHLWNMIFI